VGAFDSAIIGDVWAVLAASGVIVAAVYLLWMFRRVMFGALDKEENKVLKDLDRREVLVMVPLVLLMFWMGFNAAPFTSKIDVSSKQLLDGMKNPAIKTSMILPKAPEGALSAPMALYQESAR
jgi:NADH-quinone oxidoreductase subunit M